MEDDKDMRLTNRERTNMEERATVLGEINDILDNGFMTAEQILGELLLAMSTQELNENWDHVKRMNDWWNIDQHLGEGELIATAGE